jgi:hypothetical protein
VRRQRGQPVAGETPESSDASAIFHLLSGKVGDALGRSLQPAGEEESRVET